MCSTPRPQHTVVGKAGYSGTILSTISPEARIRFAERANLAAERRHRINGREQAQQNRRHQASTRPRVTTPVTKTVNRGWRYWLITASITDIISLLFLKHVKSS